MPATGLLDRIPTALRTAFRAALRAGHRPPSGQTMPEPAASVGFQAVRGSAMLAAGLSALPMLRLLPPWLALSLLAIGILAAATARDRSWPVLVRAALTIAMTGLVLAAYGFGFGRDTGSALLLAMLALKVSESASARDLRGLIGFALFALFAAFLQDQGPLTLALALIAVAAVIAALARLAEFEAGLGPGPGLRPRLRQTLLWLALAAPLALAGFWFYPRLGSPLWGVPENALARTGISETMAPGDWLDLLADDSPAFRARFIGPEPNRSELYWRGPVLWDFDGRRWTRPHWTSARRSPGLSEASAAFRYEITLEPSDRRFLFALDLPREAPDDASLGADLSPYALRPIRDVHRYALTAYRADAVQAELPDGMRAAALRLPPGYNPRSVERARTWRREAGSDDAYIERLLAWFNREFSYSLAAPPLGRHTGDEFLFETRIGYCEHFSSAFAILTRAAGIPTRVVTGYVGGYRNPYGDYWLIQQSDAHAWVEVWLAGRGWTRIDPTAAVDPSRVFDRYRGGLGAGALGQALGGTLAPLGNALDWLREHWNSAMLGFGSARQRLLLRPLGIDQASQSQLLIAFATLAGLAIAFAVWAMARQGRSHETDPLLRAWHRLCRRLRRHGLEKQPWESALAFARRAAARLDTDDGHELLRLSQGFARLRYAEPNPTVDDPRQLIEHLDAFRPLRR